LLCDLNQVPNPGRDPKRKTQQDEQRQRAEPLIKPYPHKARDDHLKRDRSDPRRPSSGDRQRRAIIGRIVHKWIRQAGRQYALPSTSGWQRLAKNGERRILSTTYGHRRPTSKSATSFSKLISWAMYPTGLKPVNGQRGINCAFFHKVRTASLNHCHLRICVTSFDASSPPSRERFSLPECHAEMA